MATEKKPATNGDSFVHLSQKKRRTARGQSISPRLANASALGKLLARTMKYSQIIGGCYCGKVRFKATQEPIQQANCHCANCRRAAGAQAVAWITVPRARFEFEQGKPKEYRSETGAIRTFCDTCGTSLTYEIASRPGEIDITTGSLDQPENFAPARDVFPEEKLPWVQLVKHRRG
jgi:hypothetical protein